MSRKAVAPRAVPARKSTIGRPRMLTDEQLVAIMAWHDAMSVWKAHRATVKTLRQFAKEMGVTHGTWVGFLATPFTRCFARASLRV